MTTSTRSRKQPPDHLLNLKEAEELLQPFKPLLEECIQHGWDSWSTDYSHKHHLLSSRARAAIVFDEIVFSAEQRFSGLPGVSFERRQNSFLLYIGNDVVLRFKKIRKNGKCNSIDTRQQVLFRMQMELPGMETGTLLHAGYALDDLQRTIVKKMIVCQFANQVLWTIDLLTEVGGAIENMPLPPPIPPKGPRWELKREPELDSQKDKKKREIGRKE